MSLLLYLTPLALAFVLDLLIGDPYFSAPPYPPHRKGD